MKNEKYVGTMKFDCACVRNFLAQNGYVFTVRSYNLNDADVNVEGIGVCSRKKLMNVDSMKDLVSFVHGSGFRELADSIDSMIPLEAGAEFDVVAAWYGKICSYGASKGCLYLIRKKN